MPYLTEKLIWFRYFSHTNEHRILKKNATWRWQWAHSVTAFVLCLFIYNCVLVKYLLPAHTSFLVNSIRELENLFLECSQYFSRLYLAVFYDRVKFQSPNCNTSWDANYYPGWFLVKSICQLENLFLECSQYFSEMHLAVFYNVVMFQSPNCNTFWYMIFGQVFLVKYFRSSPYRRTDRKRCIWAHRAKCTGGLKNVLIDVTGSHSGIVISYLEKEKRITYLRFISGWKDTIRSTNYYVRK